MTIMVKNFDKGQVNDYFRNSLFDLHLVQCGMTSF